MQSDDFPRLARRLQPLAQPLRLLAIGCYAVRFVGATIKHENVHRPVGEVVITPVAGRVEVGEVSGDASVAPIVVAERGVELVGVDVIAVVLENVGFDGVF